LLAVRKVANHEYAKEKVMPALKLKGKRGV